MARITKSENHQWVFSTKHRLIEARHVTYENFPTLKEVQDFVQKGGKVVYTIHPYLSSRPEFVHIFYQNRLVVFEFAMPELMHDSASNNVSISLLDKYDETLVIKKKCLSAFFNVEDLIEGTFVRNVYEEFDVDDDVRSFEVYNEEQLQDVFEDASKSYIW